MSGQQAGRGCLWCGESYAQYVPCLLWTLACSNMRRICAGATAETLKDCTTGLVFGLPASNWNWVQHVREGYASQTLQTLHNLAHSIQAGLLA